MQRTYFLLVHFSFSFQANHSIFALPLVITDKDEQMKVRNKLLISLKEHVYSLDQTH